MKALPLTIDAVLFDLDGTLLDSAPDLYDALVRQCAEEGAPSPAYAAVRPVVSRGARAVLRSAFADRGETAVEALLPRFLALYQEQMGQATQPFDGIEALLGAIETHDLRWGIVTNKAGFLAGELIARMGWSERAAAVVCGDTLAVSKPDPAPVRLACERADVVPEHSLFVGDDPRDVRAGRDAGLYTVAVTWGYLGGEDPHAWGADVVIDHPDALAAMLWPA